MPCLTPSHVSALRDFLATEPSAAKRLFWRGEVLHAEEIDARLIISGLVGVRNSMAKACVQIYSRRGMHVVTDFPSRPARDRVFPVFSDENELLVRLLNSRPWRRVLDLGSGSGLLALAATHEGGRAVGVDISGRATRFAVFNSLLNGAEKRTAFVTADISAVTGGSFWDLVVANPPFVPVPPQARFHLAGAGGPCGVDILKEVFRVWGRALPSGSTCVMLALSLVDQDGNQLVAHLGPDPACGGSRAIVVPIYRDRLPLFRLWECFQHWDPHRQWLDSLHRLGYVALDYICLLAGPHAEELASTLQSLSMHSTTLAGSWAGRLQRYHVWANQDTST